MATLGKTPAREKKGSPAVKDDQFVVRGGKPISGEVALAGAKNAAPKELVATLLTDKPCRLENVPAVEDVAVTSQLIQCWGGRVQKKNKTVVEVVNQIHRSPDWEELAELNSKSRIPILFAGPLLARRGEAKIPHLGGCRIGPRPINFHLQALRQLGATVEETAMGLQLRASRLRGAKIRLDYPSVGATEQIILASVLAEGITELANAAVEPEIIDLILVLQKMGAVISVETDRTITIVGVNKLSGFEHRVLPDRLEAASWACAAGATNGEIFVRHARQAEMMTFLNKFRQAGGGFAVKDEGIKFWREKKLQAVTVETDVYPGFATDWQQSFTVMLTQAKGASIIHETVYENRFDYVKELAKMGAKIQLLSECLGSRHCRFGQLNHQHSAVVVGPTTLSGAEVTVPDLRAGFSYLIAALTARGESVVKNASQLNRGYEGLWGKLKALGAEIERP